MTRLRIQKRQSSAALSVGVSIRLLSRSSLNAADALMPCLGPFSRSHQYVIAWQRILPISDPRPQRKGVLISGHGRVSGLASSSQANYFVDRLAADLGRLTKQVYTSLSSGINRMRDELCARFCREFYRDLS